MLRRLSPIVAVVATALVVALPAARATLPARRAAIFYYDWYGTPAVDGAWLHWGQNDHTPPSDLATTYYPARGPYSSSDSAVVNAQMDEIAATGIREVIVTWWGSGSTEDARLALVLWAARAHGLVPAIHVEPYAGRTPATVADDVRRLADLGVHDFYVYGAESSPPSEWAAANAERPPGTRLLAQTTKPGFASAAGFDGLYTYDVLSVSPATFDRLCRQAHRLGLSCEPSVGPGFDARRATGDPRVRPRRGGATYDWMWRAAIAAGADAVTITSYNEWHEGTQIEPAVTPPRSSASGSSYQSYAGDYGARGEAAGRAYLDRTAYWVARLSTAPGPAAADSVR